MTPIVARAACITVLLCLPIAVLLVERAAPVRAPSADVIVVLAHAPERVAFARDLVREGLAPRLVSTLVDPACVRAGHAPALCSSGVRNTVDEALLMRRSLPPDGVRRVTVVTSSYHRLRAALIFGIMFAGSGIHVRVVGSPGPLPDREDLAHELLSFLPSAGAAAIARLSPSLYERLLWAMSRAAGAARGLFTDKQAEGPRMDRARVPGRAAPDGVGGDRLGPIRRDRGRRGPTAFAARPPARTAAAHPAARVSRNGALHDSIRRLVLPDRDRPCAA